MQEVAGILIGDAQGEIFQGSGEAEGAEKFGDIAHLFAKSQSLGVLGLARGEEVGVLLEGGTAAGGVGEDGVEAVLEEHGEVAAGEVAGDVAHPGVGGQRAAAELARGHDDFASVSGEDADGGFVEASEADLGDAAGEKGDAGAARPLRGIAPAQALEEKRVLDGRQEPLARGQAQQAQGAAFAREPLQTAALVEAGEARGGGDAVGIGQEAAID